MQSRSDHWTLWNNEESLSKADLTVFKAWIRNRTNTHLWDAIKHACPKFSGGLAQSATNAIELMAH